MSSPMASNMTCRLSRLVVAGVLIGCAADPVAPPVEQLPLTFQGTVQDPAGRPVEGALVVVQLWSGDSSLATPYLPDSPFAVTEANGSFRLVSPPVPVDLVDRADLRTMSPGCEGRWTQTVIPRSSLLPEGAEDLTLTQPGVTVGATSGSVQVCGYGVHPFWGASAYVLGLRFESLGGPSLSGRWRINYQFSSGDDEGAFVGAQTEDYVVLELTHDAPSSGCARMRLYADLSPTGVWGPMSVIDQVGCVPDPMPFHFVEDTFLVVR